MTECKHGRVTVLRVTEQPEVVRAYLANKEHEVWIFWMEICNYCDRRLLNRAHPDELPDRVERFMKNRRASIDA